jgi:hypothetical protein
MKEFVADNSSKLRKTLPFNINMGDAGINIK